MVDLTIGNVTGSPGYGGIEQYSDVAMADITSTPVVIPASQGAVTFPQNVAQDFANNALRFEVGGVWNVTLSIAFLFTGENFGRQYDVDLYDIEDDVLVVFARISVGRNAEGSVPAASLLFDVDPEKVGHRFQLRVSSAADTFTDVILNFYSFNIIRVDVPRTS